MSVSLSVQIKQLGSHWADFHEYSSIFSKICWDHSSFINIWEEKQFLCMHTGIHLWSLNSEFFLERKLFQTKFAEKNIIFILYSTYFFFRKPWRLWDNVGKNTLDQNKDDNTIRHKRFACWITKATNTHSEFVILVSFPRQKWLRERTLILRYTYIVPPALKYPLTKEYFVPSVYKRIWFAQCFVICDSCFR